MNETIITTPDGQNLAATGKFAAKTPIVFALPVSDYSDEMDRKRNREWYLKMKRLEKKSQVVKQELEALLERHVLRLSHTKEIIAASNRVLGRQSEAILLKPVAE